MKTYTRDEQEALATRCSNLSLDDKHALLFQVFGWMQGAVEIPDATPHIFFAGVEHALPSFEKPPTPAA